MERDSRLPRWAPRVPQSLIRRFYDSDAKGLYDEELIDEVGCALLARCESFIAANRARDGDLLCPLCGREVQREDVLRCPCGWELPWSTYFRTIQHKQLSGAEPVLQQFREFVARFPCATTARDRVLLIDRLIHGFHVYLRTGALTRPVAVNLIEGSLNEVVAFLEELAYGDCSTPGLAASREEWDRGIAANASWYGCRCEASDT